MKLFGILMAGMALLLGTSGSALAQEALMRQVLTQRLPQISNINSISKTPIAGVFEVRFNDTDILYSDAKGDFLLRGNLIDTKQRRDLTNERLTQLSAITFADLPLKDALTVVNGNGQRKMVVFADPNCGYCKRFEQDLRQVDNLTLYVFLYPVLGLDSLQKSQAIWCAKDQGKSWQDWMLRGVKPASAACDSSALQRNLALGRKYRINGTPTIIFSDGTRIPGVLDSQQVEKYLER